MDGLCANELLAGQGNREDEEEGHRRRSGV